MGSGTHLFCTSQKGKQSCYLAQKTELSYLCRDSQTQDWESPSAPQEDLVPLPCVLQPLLPACGGVLRESCEGTQKCMALKVTVYISPFYR